jgi:hypothetical protein
LPLSIVWRDLVALGHLSAEIGCRAVDLNQRLDDVDLRNAPPDVGGRAGMVGARAGAGRESLPREEVQVVSDSGKWVVAMRRLVRKSPEVTAVA